MSDGISFFSLGFAPLQHILMDTVLMVDCRLVDGGLLPVAPPCSLYVGISVGTHKRSESWCRLRWWLMAEILMKMVVDPHVSQI